MTEEEDKDLTEFYLRAKESGPKRTGIPRPFEVQVTETVLETSYSPTKNRELDEQITTTVLAPPPPGITSVTPSVVTWEGGTKVTILGDNFLAGATVKFGGVAATDVTVTDSTHISCVTPPHAAGTVDVEVTNPSGQSVTGTNLLRYTNLPDNFLLTGYQTVAGYQLCGGGYTYPYTLTARLGNTPFRSPPGVYFYVRLLIVNSSNLCTIWFGQGGCFFPGNNNTPIQFNPGQSVYDSLTGTFSKADNSPGSLGPNAVVFHSVYLSTSYNQVGTQLPLYGDSIFQPTSYRIIIDASAPPPTGTPPSTDYFIWIDIARPANEFPWGWISGSIHTLKIQCLHPNGTLHTGYGGTAGLTVTNLIPSNGELEIGVSTGVLFSGGEATVPVSARFTNHFPGQGYGYFKITATDGAIQGNTGTCSVLNHL